MKRATVVVLSGVLIAFVVGAWAVPLSRAAHLPSSIAARHAVTAQVERLPHRVRLREGRDDELIADAWINGKGPYRFAVDTGAGITLISQSLANAAGLRSRGRTAVLAGISGRQVSAGEALVERIALGDLNNIMPSRIRAVIVSNLPPGIDGILDPTDAYSPLGYTIDLPNHEMSAFDPRSNGLNVSRQPAGGAVVTWMRDGEARRPFVRLSDGRLALIDTGSNFGLAISSNRAPLREHARSSRDVGGGTVTSSRVEPTTVSIGALVLRGVPTDIIHGGSAPAILGRDALYPFRISFDPLHRLIEIAPSMHDND